MSVGGTEKAAYAHGYRLGNGKSIPFTRPDSPENTVYVPLTNGGEVLIDTEDAAFVCQWRWRSDTNGYACRCEGTAQKNMKHVLMHRQLLKVPEEMEVDHVNRKRLDNRKENLRPATPGEQADNASLRYNNKSGYKGVSYSTSKKGWVAQIQHRGRGIWLGLFNSKEEAAEVYAQKAIELKGVFACPDRIQK